MSTLLIRKKVLRLLPTEDTRIFPISATEKGKPLEAKDYIEIAVRYGLMEDTEILNLIFNLLMKRSYYDDSINGFPMYLYKLLVYYEKMALFEAIFEKEKLYNRLKNTDIIQASFSYAIMMNNITVALYLFQKYKRSFTENTEQILDSILHIINEGAENSGQDQNSQRYANFEELLYFLDIFIDKITGTQTTYFFSICWKILQPHSLDEEEWDDDISERFKRGIMENQLRNHFLVYSNNPIKIVVLLGDLVNQNMKKFPHMDFGARYLQSRFFEVFRQILNYWGTQYAKIEKALFGTQQM